MSSIDSPQALAHRLGLRLDDSQRELIDRLVNSAKWPVDAAGDEEQVAQRAAALYALWFLLYNPHSEVLITSPSRRDAERVISWLENVTQTVDAAMQAQTSWPTWNQMLVHGRESWRLRYVSPVPAYFDEIDPTKQVLVLALNVRSSSPKWAPMVQRLESLPARVVRVW